jgi:Protein of unknown function (DUF3105)
MSMSTPGPERVPSTVKVDKTSGQGKPPASGKGKPPAKKSTPTKGAGSKPGGAGKGRKVITPVKVNSGRSWGPIALVSVVILIAVGIIGWGVFAVAKDKHETSTPWDKRVAKISGVVDYRSKYPELKQVANHKSGALTYPVSPPVGGAHNPVWQNCMGDVYASPVPKENAVHSLEHGAVWITYKPGLDAAQIDTLKKKVEGKEYMLMSPYTGLDKNISLQAWGFQLKLDSASDSRIDQFIKAARVNASKEPGAACSGGSSSTGDTPATAPS